MGQRIAVRIRSWPRCITLPRYGEPDALGVVAATRVRKMDNAIGILAGIVAGAPVTLLHAAVPTVLRVPLIP